MKFSQIVIIKTLLNEAPILPYIEQSQPIMNTRIALSNLTKCLFSVLNPQAKP